jgi:hypothetical protein
MTFSGPCSIWALTGGLSSEELSGDNAGKFSGGAGESTNVDVSGDSTGCRSGGVGPSSSVGPSGDEPLWTESPR